MSKTFALIIILVIAATALVIIAIQPMQKKEKPTPVVQKTTPVTTADTTLSISPNTIQLASRSASADIIINSGTNTISGVQLEISYDPNILTNVKVSAAIPDGIIPQPVIILDKKNNGKISYAIGVAPSQPAIKGSGTVARITFERNPSSSAAAQTEIKILDKSLVTMPGQRESVLKEIHSGVVLLNTPSSVTKPNINQ